MLERLVSPHAHHGESDTGKAHPLSRISIKMRLSASGERQSGMTPGRGASMAGKDDTEGWVLFF
jgi:hypothetical protein